MPPKRKRDGRSSRFKQYNLPALRSDFDPFNDDLAQNLAGPHCTNDQGIALCTRNSRSRNNTIERQDISSIETAQAQGIN